MRLHAELLLQSSGQRGRVVHQRDFGVGRDTCWQRHRRREAHGRRIGGDCELHGERGHFTGCQRTSVCRLTGYRIGLGRDGGGDACGCQTGDLRVRPGSGLAQVFHGDVIGHHIARAVGAGERSGCCGQLQFGCAADDLCDGLGVGLALRGAELLARAGRDGQRGRVVGRVDARIGGRVCGVGPLHRQRDGAGALERNGEAGHGETVGRVAHCCAGAGGCDDVRCGELQVRRQCGLHSTTGDDARVRSCIRDGFVGDGQRDGGGGLAQRDLLGRGVGADGGHAAACAACQGRVDEGLADVLAACGVAAEMKPVKRRNVDCGERASACASEDLSCREEHAIPIVARGGCGRIWIAEQDVVLRRVLEGEEIATADVG
ncbi:hypothetical protein SDC9_88280 [bioreactor metagenome]|uniref:Uncharacterized protein n=1 Tax=bioreactor metagenome TaxID=1076179 RepID=A0A644ZL58_9ZZZZ